MVKMTLKVKINDLNFQYQLRASHHAGLVQIWSFQLKFVTIYRADKVKLRTDRRTDGRTDGQTPAMTIPLRPERLRGKNINGSGVRELAINSNSVQSARKRPGRLCQTLCPCMAAGSHLCVFSKYFQYVISRLLFVSVYNCRESSCVEWTVEICACL